MKTETIEKIFNFIKEKEGMKLPREWVKLIKPKIIKELETHPDGTQYRYEGDLDLDGANITKLPNDLYVDGMLDLDDCEQLTKLPNKLYVVGNLSLSDTNIEELPTKLYVGNYLNISYTNITELPNNLYVGDDLYIYSTPLAKKYTDEEIYEIVASTRGKIRGEIYR
jgi:hypothetical protein